MDDLTGRFAVSLAGRDKGAVCVIVGCDEDDNFVFIADGRARRVESPKRKKIKHIKLVDWVPEGQRRITAERFTNRLVREYIAALPAAEG